MEQDMDKDINQDIDQDIDQDEESVKRREVLWNQIFANAASTSNDGIKFLIAAMEKNPDDDKIIDQIFKFYENALYEESLSTDKYNFDALINIYEMKHDLRIFNYLIYFGSSYGIEIANAFSDAFKRKLYSERFCWIFSSFFFHLEVINPSVKNNIIDILVSDSLVALSACKAILDFDHEYTSEIQEYLGDASYFFQIVVDRNPDNWEALFLFGYFKYILNKKNEAEKYLKRSCDISENVFGRLVLGNIYKTKGHFRKAEKCFNLINKGELYDTDNMEMFYCYLLDYEQYFFNEFTNKEISGN